MPASSSSPSVLLDAVTEAGLPPQPLAPAESISPLQALSVVPDPRRARGRRHSLQSIPAVRGRRRPGRRPCGAARTVLAVDGKTLRGARDEQGEQVKLAAVFDHVEHPVLAQAEVIGGDGVATFTPVLDTIADLRGVVISADALHCQRGPAEYLHARGAHYLFTVKGNQPTLRRALARLPWAQVSALRDRQVGHGRTESRSIKVLYLDGTPEAGLFPHGARAINVVRRRRVAGRAKPSVEAVYAITPLGHRDADPRLLAGWIRSHWTIENCLHRVRDATEGEDHSSVRTGHGPQVMAALRNTAIIIIRLRGGTNIAAAHRDFSYRPTDVLDALAAA